RAARGRAAADLLDERAQRAADLHLDDAGPAQVARETEQLRAATAAEAGEPGAAALDDRRHREQRLHVVDHRGLAIEARLDGKRRTSARQRAPTLEGLQQRRLLAQHESAGAAADLDRQ